MRAELLRRGTVAEAICRHRLVVILRRVEPRPRLLALVRELSDDGARVFEVTLDAPSAADDIAALRSLLTGTPCLVGGGTIRRADQLEAAIRAGADFGVAPFLDTGLVASAVGAGLPFVPGAFTPTEVAAAWAAGATFVKLFPASAVGPAFVRELRGPLPEVELIATGGIDGTSARAFLDAGAAAVGIGGALVQGSAAQRRAIIAEVAAAGTPARSAVGPEGSA